MAECTYCSGSQRSGLGVRKPFNLRRLHLQFRPEMPRCCANTTKPPIYWAISQKNDCPRAILSENANSNSQLGGAEKSGSSDQNHVVSLMLALFKLLGEYSMQKKLIALAVASLVSAPVFAQSNVQMYGTFDAGVRHVDNANGNGQSNTTMDSAGTYNSNRWGFTGSEDLGGGMKANFTLEGGFQSGTGVGSISGGLFGRKQIVGLSGSWGRVDLGRNYTTIFYTTGAYDPFKYKYTGIIPIAGLDGARNNNDIQYTSNSMNGFVVRAEHNFGEVAGTSSALAQSEIGLSYANGPMSFGGAYATEKTDVAGAIKSTNWTIGGKYDFKPIEVMVGYDVKKTDLAAGGTTDVKNTWVGGRWDMGGDNALSAAYYDTKFTNTEGRKKLFIVGYVHNLSKRTELYADIDHLALSGNQILKGTGTNTKDSVLGFSVGINHAW
jgi:predicted porin